MRVLVCGGRDYTDRARVYAELDVEEARTETGIVSVYSGMARGADTFACEWARKRGKFLREFPAKWEQHGNKAGILRNAEMLAALQQSCSYEPLLVLAFPGGRGTADMVRRARAAGVSVRDVV